MVVAVYAAIAGTIFVTSVVIILYVYIDMYVNVCTLHHDIVNYMSTMYTVYIS